MSKKKFNHRVAVVLVSMVLVTTPVRVSAQHGPQLPQLPQVGNLFGDLANQVTSWFQQQIAQLQKTLEQQVGQWQKDAGVIVTANSTNGIPDPLKAEEELNKDTQNKVKSGNLQPNIFGVNAAITNRGVVYNATASQQLQSVLGKEAQAKTKAEMDKIAQIPSNSAQRVQASNSIVQSSSQSAQSASQIDASTQAMNASQEAAKRAMDLGEAAQKDVSTQDVVKKSAAATGQLSTIMAGLSSQLNLQASQVSNVADILSGQSSQTDQSIGLQADTVSLAATQTLTTQRILESSTITSYGVSEANKMKSGELIAAQAAKNAEAARFGAAFSTLTLAK